MQTERTTLNQTRRFWIAQTHRHGDNGLRELVDHARLPGARGIHNVGMSCIYVLFDEVYRNRLEEYLCCFTLEFRFPRIYGCCRSVNNTSDVRTTAYQDRTSQHRRMVEVIWLIQGVGFLEGKQVM